MRNKPLFGNAVLSFVYIIQCKNTSSQLSESAKKFPSKQEVAKYS